MNKALIAIILFFFAFMWAFLLMDIRKELDDLNEVHYPLCPYTEGCDEEY